MNKNISKNIISFMEEQRKSARRAFFSRREIAGYFIMFFKPIK
ncbi:hypothetical protein ACBQ57_20800 [Escherichia coli]